ncbi:MAG: hypothetical protein JSV34_02215 [Candidatus Omnitrophota bacterium]|nr:MAG: hypothetical protein JSV34_02215 [Candidatus Omnitrophota bacterium]
MSNQKEVWKLFKTDPICWVMVRFYEKVKFPIYAALTFTYLFLLPLLLAYIFSNGPFKFNILIGRFLIYGVLPILGSRLGYRWLNSILHSVQVLVGKGVLKQQDGKKANETLIKNCNKIIFILLSIFFLGCVVYHYLTGYGVRFFDDLITNIYVLFISSIWWYFIIKAFFVGVIAFYNYRSLLLAKISGEYILKISLCHPDTYYGLKSIVEYCINFLFVHIIVIGGYLTFSIWLGELYQLTSLFILCILAAYVALPVCGFFWVFRNAYKRIRQIRYEELKRLWQKIEQLNRRKGFKIDEYHHLVTLYDRAKNISFWPVGIRKGISLFSVYCVPIVSWLIQEVASIRFVFNKVINYLIRIYF